MVQDGSGWLAEPSLASRAAECLTTVRTLSQPASWKHRALGSKASKAHHTVKDSEITIVDDVDAIFTVRH